MIRQSPRAGQAGHHARAKLEHELGEQREARQAAGRSQLQGQLGHCLRRPTLARSWGDAL